MLGPYLDQLGIHVGCKAMPCTNYPILCCLLDLKYWFLQKNIAFYSRFVLVTYITLERKILVDPLMLLFKIQPRVHQHQAVVLTCMEYKCCGSP